MALIRYVIIKFGATMKFDKCSKPRFGFLVIFWCFLFSAFFSLVYYFRYDFVLKKDPWQPKDQWVTAEKPKNFKIFSCTDVDHSLKLDAFTQKLAYIFTVYGGILGKIYQLVNGILSKILPCILLPILTILLILELRKAEKNRKNSNTNAKKLT